MTSRCSGTLLALALGTLVSACATMSPEECKVANWKDVGLRDGLAGNSLTLLESRTKDCAEAKVALDAKSYLSGRDLGLKTFCRMENAVPLGLNGGSYEGVCPPWIDGEFRARFQIGRAVFDKRTEVGYLDDRLTAAERRLRNSDHDEGKRLRDVDKEDERKRIRREFDDQRHRIREEIRELDRQLQRARYDLRQAEQALGALR
jgi:hypothetical protein